MKLSSKIIEARTRGDEGVLHDLSDKELDKVVAALQAAEELEPVLTLAEIARQIEVQLEAFHGSNDSDNQNAYARAILVLIANNSDRILARLRQPEAAAKAPEPDIVASVVAGIKAEADRLEAAAVALHYALAPNNQWDDTAGHYRIHCRERARAMIQAIPAGVTNVRDKVELAARHYLGLATSTVWLNASAQQRIRHMEIADAVVRAYYE